MTTVDEIECKTVEDLHTWLTHNFSRDTSIWLVYYKKSSGIGNLSMNIIIDELLCFGWIDSLPRKVDERRTKVRISPRNPKSNWSKVNKDKVELLIKSNKMHPNGLKLITIAKENGRWDALNDVENLILPKDLLQSLNNANIVEKWHAKSRSFKRGQLEILFNSKRKETREKNILKIIDSL